MTGALAACGGDESVGVTPDGTGSGGIDLPGSTSGEANTDTDEPTADATQGESGSAEEASGGDGSCLDGIQNSDETDVDCGGPDCDACEPGQGCIEDDDCTTEVCENGECQAPTCYDGVRNGDENGIDCGGGCPNFCGQDGPCDDDFDCDEGEFCNDEGACESSACDNGVQDTYETDVDCGGQDCPDCPGGADCLQDEDCESRVCDEDTMQCLDPACDDGVHNGDETDRDCGGSCDACPNGADCEDGDDCVSMVCEDDTCVAASCMDKIENGQETDVDCGGPACNPCGEDDECDDGDDCDSGVCDMGMCAAATCDDGVQNGDETDADCGNSCGQNCEVGERCDDAGDCVEMVCEFTVCSEPDCFDGVQNGDETGEDCGGSECNACEPGEGCDDDGDCEEGVCDDMTGLCLDPECDDDVHNGGETDVDCGNECGQTCEVDELCDDDLDCVEGVCELGVCLAPTCGDDVQNGTEGGVDCQGTCPQPCDVGGEVGVNTTVADYQTQASVAVAPNGNFFVVVWTSSPGAAAAQDGDGAGVFGQLYDQFGDPTGPEFQVNTTTAGAQQFSDVTAHDNGFVVAWQSGADQDGDGTGIYVQRYDDSGVAQGAETGVNETTTNDQRRPSIAADGAGNFVVCWDSQETNFEIYCRRYSFGGVAEAGEVQINTTTSADEQLPVVARESGGAYTVAWQSSAGTDGDGIGVFMRRFSVVGAEVTAETQVNSTTDGHQSEPAIGMAGDGEFVIAFTSENLDGSVTGIAAQRFTALGAPAGTEFTVNTTTLGSQTRPAVAMNNSDAFWIAWQTDDDGDTTGVFGQRYTAAGAANGVEFVVNPTTLQRQEDPDVAIRNGTELVGVWAEGDAGFSDSNVLLIRYDGEL